MSYFVSSFFPKQNQTGLCYKDEKHDLFLFTIFLMPALKQITMESYQSDKIIIKPWLPSLCPPAPFVPQHKVLQTKVMFSYYSIDVTLPGIEMQVLLGVIHM